MRVEGLIIDPQEDFVNERTGALPVVGAEADMARLAALLRREQTRIDALHVTLDTHRFLHIAHPIWWQNADGEHPAPFTILTSEAVEQGVWRATNPTWQEHSSRYVKALEVQGRYPLCIWPYHCLLGTAGHAVSRELAEALIEWEATRFVVVDYIPKGSNLGTEHYSAIAADVPDPNDPGTLPNQKLITQLLQADIVFVGGEAGSHCVASTVRDLLTYGGDTLRKKLVLLTDAFSPVPGFETYQAEFLAEMQEKGVALTTTTEFSL